MRLHSKKGFTLVEILIVVAIIGLLAAIALPAIVGARKEGQKKACWSTLAKITQAKNQYQIDNRGATDFTAANLQQYMNGLINTTVRCPAGGTYTIGNNTDTAASCNFALHVGFTAYGDLT